MASCCRCEEAAGSAGHGGPDRCQGEGWQAPGQAGGGDVCGVPVEGWLAPGQAQGDVFGELVVLEWISLSLSLEKIASSGLPYFSNENLFKILADPGHLI